MRSCGLRVRYGWSDESSNANVHLGIRRVCAVVQSAGTAWFTFAYFRMRLAEEVALRTGIHTPVFCVGSYMPFLKVANYHLLHLQLKAMAQQPYAS